MAIKASMNLGLSESLQAAFPDLLPMSRPLVNNPTIDPEWIAGFASASPSQGLPIEAAGDRRPCRLESRMMGNYHVRFGGGGACRLESHPGGYLKD